MTLYGIISNGVSRVLAWLGIMVSSFAPLLGMLLLTVSGITYASNQLGYISAFAAKINELGVMLQVSAWPAFMAQANVFVPISEFLNILPFFIAFKIAAFFARFAIRIAVSSVLKAI